MECGHKNRRIHEKKKKKTYFAWIKMLDTMIDTAMVQANLSNIPLTMRPRHVG